MGVESDYFKESKNERLKKFKLLACIFHNILPPVSLPAFYFFCSLDNSLLFVYNDRILTKGYIMQAVLYSQARNNLREIINKVCNDFDEYIITTKEKQSVVLISQEEYNSMKETIYLLSSKNNRDRLLSAVDQIDSSKFIEKDLDV